MSQPQVTKLKSGSQKRKETKDRERRRNEGSQLLTNFFSKKGEHKRLNTQDGTPFLKDKFSIFDIKPCFRIVYHEIQWLRVTF